MWQDWDLSDVQTRLRHRQSGQWVPDGSFSANRRKDLEYFSYCPQLSHLSVSQQNTDVQVHSEEHSGEKHNHMMITSNHYSYI